MKEAKFLGTGQLNGPVIINKVIEIDDKIAINLRGQNSDRVILDIMQSHYPGVTINPRKVSVQINNIRKKDTTKLNQHSNRGQKVKKSFTITNLILWIVFFPFKLGWWLLKKIWNEDHV